MTDIDYAAVTAQYTAMGFSYPNRSDFSEEDIAARIERLSADERKTTDAGTLKGKQHTTRTMRAFLELADALGGEVTQVYNGYAVVRACTPEELRETALSLLCSELNAEHRALAEQALRDSLPAPGQGSGLEGGPLAVVP